MHVIPHYLWTVFCIHYLYIFDHNLYSTYGNSDFLRVGLSTELSHLTTVTLIGTDRCRRKGHYFTKSSVALSGFDLRVSIFDLPRLGFFSFLLERSSQYLPQLHFGGTGKLVYLKGIEYITNFSLKAINHMLKLLRGSWRKLVLQIELFSYMRESEWTCIG